MSEQAAIRAVVVCIRAARGVLLEPAPRLYFPAGFHFAFANSITDFMEIHGHADVVRNHPHLVTYREVSFRARKVHKPVLLVHLVKDGPWRFDETPETGLTGAEAVG